MIEVDYNNNKLQNTLIKNVKFSPVHFYLVLLFKIINLFFVKHSIQYEAAQLFLRSWFFTSK